jgi:SAM-dependent methyltransferase
MADHTHHHAHHHHHHHGGDGGPESTEREARLAEMLDLDAEVLHELHAQVADWLTERAADLPVRRFLDLGSGTGAGTFALLRRFPGAEAVAVDGSPRMVEHLLARAEALGVGTADRVHTVEADLDGAWPDFGEVDLAWSATAMHHMADPARAMREVFAALRPGGLFALVEIDSQPTFLPEELGIGRPGLEARCRALQNAQRAVELPFLGADWAPLLSAAGFEVADARRFDGELTPPRSRTAGRYAQLVLGNLRERLAETADADDLAVLDQLTADDGPHSVLRRDDLIVRAERQVWLGRRPAA